MVRFSVTLFFCLNICAFAGDFFSGKAAPKIEPTDVFKAPFQSQPPRFSKIIRAKTAFLHIDAEGKGESLLDRAKAIHRFSKNLRHTAEKHNATLNTLSLDYVVDKELQDGFFSSKQGLPYSLPSQIIFRLGINLDNFEQDLFTACFKLNEIIQKAGSGISLELKLSSIKVEYNFSREELRREIILNAKEELQTWYKKIGTSDQLVLNGLDDTLKFIKISPTSYRAYVQIEHKLVAQNINNGQLTTKVNDKEIKLPVK